MSYLCSFRKNFERMQKKMILNGNTRYDSLYEDFSFSRKKYEYFLKEIH